MRRADRVSCDPEGTAKVGQGQKAASSGGIRRPSKSDAKTSLDADEGVRRCPQCDLFWEPIVGLYRVGKSSNVVSSGLQLKPRVRPRLQLGRVGGDEVVRKDSGVKWEMMMLSGQRGGWASKRGEKVRSRNWKWK